MGCMQSSTVQAQLKWVSGVWVIGCMFYTLPSYASNVLTVGMSFSMTSVLIVVTLIYTVFAGVFTYGVDFMYEKDHKSTKSKMKIGFAVLGLLFVAHFICDDFFPDDRRLPVGGALVQRLNVNVSVQAS
jgi:hypothetical protein